MKPKRPRDINQFAYQIVQESAGQAPEPALTVEEDAGQNPTVTPGKLDAPARAASMRAEERTELARKATTARWAKKP